MSGERAPPARQQHTTQRHGGRELQITTAADDLLHEHANRASSRTLGSSERPRAFCVPLALFGGGSRFVAAAALRRVLSGAHGRGSSRLLQDASHNKLTSPTSLTPSPEHHPSSLTAQLHCNTLCLDLEHAQCRHARPPPLAACIQFTRTGETVLVCPSQASRTLSPRPVPPWPWPAIDLRHVWLQSPFLLRPRLSPR